MPQTEDLYPGKFTDYSGKLDFAPLVGPTYNGDLNQYAGNNPNTNTQFKVFQKGPNGEIMSQNKALINQDVYDLTQKNHDLAFYLRNFQQYPETYEEKYDLIQPVNQINLQSPVRSVLHPS